MSSETAFRPHSTSSPRLNFKSAFVLLGLFGLVFGIAYSPALPVWDAAFYYAYMRSAILDGDQKLDNDFQELYARLPSDDPFVRRRVDRERTVTGYVKSTYPVGTSILALPWMVLANGLYHITHALPPSGYEPTYVWLTGIALSAFGCLAMLLTLVLTRRVAAPRNALVATAVVGLASPLIYYQFREVFYSHTASPLITALLLVVWWPLGNQKDLALGKAAAIGVMTGLAMLVRWQHVIYLILPACTVLKDIRRNGRRQSLQGVLYLAIVAINALICFSPQLAHWHKFYGEWLALPQGSDYMEWRLGFLIPTLFSPFRGLFFWMPLFFFSSAGLAWLARRKPDLVIPMLLIVGLSLYVNASVRDWFGGGGYGPRRWLSELPILTIGLAGFLEMLPVRLRSTGSTALSGALIIHQWLLLRYGLADRIGGRVASMYPDYRWHETSGVEFLKQWVTYLRRVITDPVQSFVFPDAPVDLIVKGHSDAPTFLAIAAVAIGSVALSAALAVWAWRHPRPSARWPLLTALTAGGCLVISAWILSAG